MNKKELAEVLGVSRSLLYYKHKQKDKDWKLKIEIEKVLRNNRSYGHKRIALKLKINKKRVLRVMKIYGIKPYRRRGKKWLKSKKNPLIAFTNLLLSKFPEKLNQIWVSDFTYLHKDIVSKLSSVCLSKNIPVLPCFTVSSAPPRPKAKTGL